MKEEKDIPQTSALEDPLNIDLESNLETEVLLDSPLETEPDLIPDKSADSDSAKESSVADTIQFILIIGLVALTILVSRLPLYSVVGQSMENTFFNGNVLIGDKTPDIQAGDILIIDSTVLDERIIKRCIGLPGDTVEIKDNIMYVNGEALQEDYIKEPMETEDLSVTLGEDEYFVAGDNRNHSTDSREIGVIPIDSIEAEVTYNLTDKLGLTFKKLTIIRRGIVGISILYIAYVLILWLIVDPIRNRRQKEMDDEK